MSQRRYNPNDPNDRAKMQFAQRAFAGQVTRGEVYPVDRFGRRIDVGSLIVWKTPEDLAFQVVEVTPVLHPQAAPGQVLVTLQVSVQVPVFVGQAAGTMIQVGKVTEPGHADMTQDAPAPPQPPVDMPNFEGETPEIELTDGPTAKPS